jgi:hypothetical protein
MGVIHSILSKGQEEQKLQFPVAEEEKKISRQMKEGFVKFDIFKTTWEVPSKYKHLAMIGAGSFGQVW